MSFLRRVIRLPYFPITLAPFLLFAPTFLTGRALFWGTSSLQFVPWWSFAFETLLSGQLPLWNPYVGMGAPLVANYQSALFFPPNWIYFFLYLIDGPAGIAWGQALVLSIQLAFAGVGMAYLVRRLGLDPLPQTIAGLAFCLSGYLVARAGFLSITSTVIWIPWALLLGFSIARPSRSWKYVGFLGVLIGLQLLAGHAQTATYSLVLIFLWVTFWAWRAHRSSADRGKLGISRSIGMAWVGLGIAAAIGLAIAAVQLIPTAEYLAQSQRAQAVDFEFAMTYSFWPWRFLTLLAPDLFGTPAAGNYWGYGAFWEDALYLGLIPLVMALRAIIRAIGPNQRLEFHADNSVVSPSDLRALTFGLAVLVIVSFILALGNNTPIFPWLYQNVPGFDMFQAPTRYTIWAVTGLAILAAIGSQGWGAPDGRALYWTRLGTAGAAAVMGAAILGWFLLVIDQNSFFVAMAKAGFWGLLLGILTLRAPAAGVENTTRSWAWAVTIILAADLLLAGWGLNPSVSLEYYREPAPTANDVVTKANRGRLYLAAAEEYDLKFERLFLFSSFDPGEDWVNARGVMLPNLHMLDHIPHTANFDPLLPGRYVRWMEVLESADRDVQEKLLNLSGVSLVESSDPSSSPGVRYDFRGGGARFRWYTCAIGSKGGSESLDILLEEGWEETQMVILERALRPLDKDCGSGSAVIEELEDRPNQLSLHVKVDKDGWLFIADTWYPGWIATVDDQMTEVLRANYLFRAVNVPEGDHRIELVYQAETFQLGLMISGLALATLAITVGFVLSRRRRR